MKEVIAVTRGFHGHLIEPGEKFTIGDDEELGAWMREVGKDGRPVETKAAIKEAKVKEIPLASAPFNVPAQIYKVKHNGGGNFIVIDAEGTQVGEPFMLNKADNTEAKSKAQAEADRMNAGDAAPTISPTAAANIAQADVVAAHDTGADQDDGLPDA